MGFTVENFSLFGLPELPNLYVSIKGSYSIAKLHPFLNTYEIKYVVHFSTSNKHITKKDMYTHVQILPEPADIYTIIYDNIKKSLDPLFKTPSQTVTFADDF